VALLVLWSCTVVIAATTAFSPAAYPSRQPVIE
jgi:hypothetical protein